MVSNNFKSAINESSHRDPFTLESSSNLFHQSRTRKARSGSVSQGTDREIVGNGFTIILDPLEVNEGGGETANDEDCS